MHTARAARACGFDSLPSLLRTFLVPLLGGIIENQNSDFVMK
jgi:hypothetical protein